MEKTFFIAQDKWMMVFGAFIFIFNGVIMATTESAMSFAFNLGLFNLIFSISFLLWAILRMSKKSKYAPKIKISDNVIELKSKVLKQAKVIPWNEIKSVNFKGIQISLESSEEQLTFPKTVNLEQTNQIKDLLRKFATSKNIEVTVG